MLMKDVAVGSLVLTREKMGEDEVRETFYRRLDEELMEILGCVQGEPSKPRFMRFSEKPTVFKLIRALPVLPAIETLFPL